MYYQSTLYSQTIYNVHVVFFFIQIYEILQLYTSNFSFILFFHSNLRDIKWYTVKIKGTYDLCLK